MTRGGSQIAWEGENVEPCQSAELLGNLVVRKNIPSQRACAFIKLLSASCNPQRSRSLIHVHIATPLSCPSALRSSVSRPAQEKRWYLKSEIFNFR